MKVLIVAAALLALASAQKPTDHPPMMECQCGVFISVPQGEIEIHRMKNFHMDSCDQTEKCLAGCMEEWVLAADGGDLDAELDNGNTLGQELCPGAQNLHH